MRLMKHPFCLYFFISRENTWHPQNNNLTSGDRWYNKYLIYPLWNNYIPGSICPHYIGGTIFKSGKSFYIRGQDELHQHRHHRNRRNRGREVNETDCLAIYEAEKWKRVPHLQSDWIKRKDWNRLFPKKGSELLLLPLLRLFPLLRLLPLLLNGITSASLFSFPPPTPKGIAPTDELETRSGSGTEG